MSSMPREEYDEWKGARTDVKNRQQKALLGTYDGTIGGAKTGSVSAEYKNQQETDFADELKIDAGFGAVPYDMYDLLDEGDQGAPVTAQTEQEILEAAVNGKWKISDTIPAQVQLSLMQAARKAHNNWKQRRQQLLTHRQLVAANQLAFDTDLEKLSAGQTLLGNPNGA